MHEPSSAVAVAPLLSPGAVAALTLPARPDGAKPKLGVIFSGGWDGMLRAFASDDGHLLWQYNMVRDYETVNHVPAKGGSMAAAGPTVAGGMLFVGSGYVFGAGTAGNALLVFSAQ